MTVIFAFIGLLLSPPRSADGAVAALRTVELTADLEGSQLRVSVAASGEFPVQQIQTLEMWIDGDEIAIPRRAYHGTENPNPSAIEIQTSSGTNGVLANCPPDAVLPLLLLTIWSHSGDWSLVLVVEAKSTVLSFVSNDDSVECRHFDPRYKPVCDKVDQINQKGVFGSDDSAP